MVRHFFLLGTLVWVEVFFSRITSQQSPVFPVNEKRWVASPRPVLANDSLVFYCVQFNHLNTQIRDGKINKATAQEKAGYLLRKIKYQYTIQNSRSAPKKKAFPVQGYGREAIGGVNGNGYLPGSYNYYDGNKHTGHPAHDIFIRDTDQDLLDDRTRKPVNIRVVSAGVVIAYEPQWNKGSALRGGVYVWVYDPQEQRLYYYAHLRQLLVKPGDLVPAGTILGSMGRTGLNAYQKRSPTHLHLMALQVTSTAALPPINLYSVLTKL
jgi:hypothetical protein